MLMVLRGFCCTVIENTLHISIKKVYCNRSLFQVKTKKTEIKMVSVTKVVKGKKTTVKEKKKVAVTIKTTKYGKWKCKLNSWRG